MYILPRENKKYNIVKKSEEPYALEVCAVLDGKPCSIGDDIKSQAVINEQYVRGIQSDDRYRKFFQNKNSKNGMEKYFTVDDLDLSPLGLLRLIYRSMDVRLNKVTNYSNIELVDEKSKQERRRYMIEMETLLELQNTLKEALGGVDVIAPKLKEKGKLNDFTPATLEELEFYNKIGYKNSLEILLEKHIDIINDGNNYDFEIQKMVNHNLIISGVCATHLYYDSDNRIVEEPIHIKDLKVIGGTKRNYEDAQAFIIEKKYSVDGFFAMVKDSISATAVNAEGKVVADAHKLEECYNQLLMAADTNGVLSVKLCYWSTFDDYSMKVIFKDDMVALRNHDGNSHIKNKVHKWYKAFYVKAIDRCFNYGAIPNMTRKKVNGKFTTAYSPVTLIRGVFPDLKAASPIHPLRRIEDVATLLWGKLQNEIARMKPTRTEIDLKAMAETTEILKVVMPDIQVTDVMNALNVGLGLTGTATLDGNKASNRNPYQTVTYPVQILNSYLIVINMIMDMCFQFAGVPRVDVGVEQDKRYSNFVTKMGLQGADKAIVELMENKDELVRYTAEKKANMVIRLYQSKDKLPNPYAALFDDYEADMLSDIDFSISREFTVKIEKGFTEEDIAEIKQTMMALNQRFMQTNGSAGIDFGDNLKIMEILKENPKLAKYKIEMLLSRTKKEAEERSMRMQQQNQLMQMQSNQQAQQGEAQLMAMKQQMDELKQKFEMQFAAFKSQLKMQEDTNKIMAQKGMDAILAADEAGGAGVDDYSFNEY